VDVSLSLAAMPALALLTLISGLIVSLASPGPIFYWQERVGRGGRRFRCLKFRTMHVGADSAAHRDYCAGLIRSNAPMMKLDARGDARLIPGARLFRAAGLDELPQILNVLRGEMSIVGPRPCTVYEYERYLPWHRARCDAVPGLTGLWQVSGKNQTTFEEMVCLDLNYISNRSPGLDFRILVRTFGVVLRQVQDAGTAREAVAPARTSAQAKVEV